MTLTSSQNPLLKKVRRAVDEGRPTDTGAVVAEGPHLLAEALRSNWAVEQVFFSSEDAVQHDSLLHIAAARGIETIEISARTFRSLSNTAHGQGILSLLLPRSYTWADIFEPAGPVIILDGIQDPGNAGTIIRSVEAFGAAGVIFTTGCVRISNGKLLRAAAGSLFRTPHLENLSRRTVIEDCRAAERTLFALMPDAEDTLFSKRLPMRCAFIVGSEGNGISSDFLSLSQPLSIPTRGVESLNAAVACSIVLFEAARQRENHE